MKTTSHPIKLYEVRIESENPVTQPGKERLLESGIKYLMGRGRVVLSAKYTDYYDFLRLEHQGLYMFQVVYVGRKSIRRKGIRHQLRKGFKEYNPSTYIFPRVSI